MLPCIGFPYVVTEKGKQGCMLLQDTTLARSAVGVGYIFGGLALLQNA